MTSQQIAWHAPAPRRVRWLVLALFVCLGGAEALAGPLRGTVRDAYTDEPVPGATIHIEGTDASAISDADGSFVIDDVDDAQVTLRVLSDLYAPHEQSFSLHVGASNDVLVLLEPASEVIQMTGQAPTAVIAPGQSRLDRLELRTAPGSRGDPVQAVRSLPGMSTAAVNSGTLGALIVVRGTAPEDSAFMIDGVPIPSASHFGDVQSIVPAELIDEVEFLPGGFDVEHGGATGGIVHVKTRRPDGDGYRGAAEVSFINAGGYFEGPLSRDGAWRIAAGVRRSFIDALFPIVIPEDSTVTFSTPPYYYDGQVRLDYEPSSRHRFTLLSLLSYDRMTFNSSSENPEDPALTGRLGLTSSFWRSALTWRYSDGGVENTATASVGGLVWDQNLSDEFWIDFQNFEVIARDDVKLRLSPWLNLRAGGSVTVSERETKIRMVMPPQEGSPEEPSFSTSPLIDMDQNDDDDLAAAYAAVDIDPIERLRVTAGVRADYFDRYRATRVSPRVHATLRVIDGWKLRASAGQYTRGAGISAEALADHIDPERATHYVAGTDVDLGAGLDLSLSGFYNHLDDLVVISQTPMSENPLDSYSNDGSGRTYGAEAVLRAKRDDFFGWASYTLSRSERRDADGMPLRLFDGDQTHNLVVVGSYQFGAWRVGGRFRYASGTPTTPVVGSVYQSDVGLWRPIYGAVNSERVEAAHQLDLRVDRRWDFEHWRLSAYLDVTNVYAHPQVYGYDYNYDYSKRTKFTDIPILPAVGVRGEF
ncbi:TonB-dependent receptor [Haliangium sp.]|uniref:TonB-dependent receptor n=1 Tax=Haliangium sp. TaxID=2663208 RepID=UPI003D0A9DD7